MYYPLISTIASSILNSHRHLLTQHKRKKPLSQTTLAYTKVCPCLNPPPSIRSNTNSKPLAPVPAIRISARATTAAAERVRGDAVELVDTAAKEKKESACFIGRGEGCRKEDGTY
jgi:hypothetical protein